jgi:archaellum biogenesis protein FlaJ (TadC family)
MFKKLTAILLLLAFSQVYAASPMSADLNKSFDELNYKLNVEWNQKDSKFYNETIEGFENEIEVLRSRGLTTKDLFKYITDKIKNQEVQNEINEISKIIDESGMSPADARTFTISKVEDTFSHGASWNGRIGVKSILVISAIIVVLAISRHHQSENN